MSVRETRGGPLALEAWARNHIDGYKNCSIKNMTTSWRNGLAFCALIHRFRPDLINYDDLDPNDIVGNCTLAFETAERQLGIPALLDPMDMLALEVPDRLSVLTYVAQYYNTFKNTGARAVFNGAGHETATVERRNGNHTTKRTLDIEDEALNEARKKLSANSSPVMLRNSAACSVCQNPVFISERILFNKKLYHRSCFRCFNCNNVLNPQTADTSNEGLLFCIENTCFIELQKRSRESKVNTANSTSSISTNSVTESPHKLKESASEHRRRKEDKHKIELPNVSALKKSFETASSSSSGVSSEAQSLDSTNNQPIVSINEDQGQVHEPKIRFDETVTVKSSSEDDASKNESAATQKELKSANETDEVQELGRRQLHESPSRTSVRPEPSDQFVLRPDSSLISQIQQREEEEVIRRNTAANEGVARAELRTTSGIDVKSVKEMPNIYSDSVLPVSQCLERNVLQLDDGKKNQFLSGMLNENEDAMNENYDKVKINAENQNSKAEHKRPEPVEPKPCQTVKVGPEIRLELEPGTEVVVKQEVNDAEIKVKVEPVETIEKSEELTVPMLPATPPFVSKSAVVISPTAAATTTEESPGPSPMPRRKSPAPSMTSTTSTMSLTETASTPSPAPTPRRVKTKPPRPAPPSKASLTSLTSVTSRGSIPSAKELWKKDNYYPSELNPFESEEDLPTRPNSTSAVASSPASTAVPGNPFEDDEDEPVQEKAPSPKPSPRVRSARNQVNSITESRHRSRSRSKSRSPSRKSQISASPSPAPSPRVPRPVSLPAQAPSSEPKPYNPFEDGDDEENSVPPSEAESESFSSQVVRRREGSGTSSGASSVSAPVPKARQSLPATSSVEVGSMKKSNKTKRAPLPPSQGFAASPSNPSSEYSNGAASTTPPRSPKSILKHANNENQNRLISPSSTSGSPKKVIPASPDLLRGLKSKPKKKRRAPPPRRRVEPLPEEAIKREMNDLIVKERELERQGITLESNIRRLMEQQESIVVPEDGTNQGEGEGVGSSIEQQVDEMMVQLWNIVNEKNDILRRQTELEYLRRGHRLEEMQAELEFKLRVLMDTPVHERQNDYEQVEQMLLDELLKLVDERNDVVEWLDFNRKQDLEENALISSTITSYPTTASLQRHKHNSEKAPVELVKEDGKSKPAKVKKDKHKSKDKDKKNTNNKAVAGEKTEKEKEKQSKIKTLLFGKKKHKSISLKNGLETELTAEEAPAVNGSENHSADAYIANTELHK